MKPVDIIQELYIPVLGALSVKPDERDVLVASIAGASTELTVGTKVIYLPTDRVLREVDHDKQVIFHPLSENIARGDSAVQNMLRHLVTFLVTAQVISIGTALITLAADSSYHDSFTSDQLELLSLLPKVDAKSIKNFTTGTTNIDVTTNKLINIYTKRNGKVGEQHYNRVCNISFPAIKQLENVSESKIWNFKELRKKDIEDFKKLFEYILPNSTIAGAYSSPSDSMHAPSFQALILSFNKMHKQLVAIHQRYHSLFERLPDNDLLMQLPCDLGYEVAINDLNKFNNLIPPMAGNIGSVDAKEAAANSLTTQAQPKAYGPKEMQFNPNQAQPQQMTEQAPVQQPVQQQPQYQQPQPVQPQYQQPPQQPMYQQPQPVYQGAPNPQQPVYQQPTQQQQYQQNPQYQQPQPQQQPQRAIGFPGFQPQPVYGGYQQPQPQAIANDPFASWNANTAPQPQMYYNQQPQYQQPMYQQPQPQGGFYPQQPQYQQPVYPQQPQYYPQQPQPFKLK